MLKSYAAEYKFYLLTGLVYLIPWLINAASIEDGRFGVRFINEVWRVIYIIPVNILFFEIVLPKITWRKPLRSVFFMFAMVMLWSFGLYGWRGIGVVLHIFTPLQQFKTIEEGTSHHVAFSFGSVIFFAVVKHFYDYYKLKQSVMKLRIEKQEAELNYLKAQTNPHFLFNTLNNIYALSREKSDLVPDSILSLSKILRFTLYQAGSEYIAVEQEIKIIADYIALEKLRYDDSLRINFNHDIDEMKQSVPPLLMLPLIENAFKHGASETRTSPFVDIHLSVKQKILTLIVKNSVEVSENEHPPQEHIGLSNLRRQLALLYTDYSLILEQKKSVFTVNLTINLKSRA